MVRLTPKQEKFCQCIVSGMTGKDSYLTAYNTNGNPDTAYVEASKLLIKEAIQQRIKTLRTPQEEAAKIEGLNARQEQIKEIQERIAICKAKEDEQSLIRYYDMLNKIYALYKETERTEDTQNNVTALDDETLKKLLAAGQGDTQPTRTA